MNLRGILAIAIIVIALAGCERGTTPTAESPPPPPLATPSIDAAGSPEAALRAYFKGHRALLLKSFSPCCQEATGEGERIFQVELYSNTDIETYRQSEGNARFVRLRHADERWQVYLVSAGLAPPPSNTPEEALRAYYAYAGPNNFLRLLSFTPCCQTTTLDEEQMFQVSLESSRDTGAYSIGRNGRFVRIRIRDGRWNVYVVAPEPGFMNSNPPPKKSPTVR
jgi:hypothetical protein